MNKKKRNAYKKHIKKLTQPINPVDLKKSEIEKQISKVNARLDSLSRHYKNGTWASKRLQERLNTVTVRGWQNGRVKIPKNVTMTQLKALEKAIYNFNNSLTSTHKGILKQKELTLEGIKNTFNSFEDENLIDDEDAEDLYNLLDNNDFSYFSERIPSSELWAYLIEAREGKIKEQDFANTLLSRINSNDEDVREKAKRLYNKYC